MSSTLVPSLRRTMRLLWCRWSVANMYCARSLCRSTKSRVESSSPWPGRRISSSWRPFGVASSRAINSWDSVLMMAIWEKLRKSTWNSAFHSPMRHACSSRMGAAAHWIWASIPPSYRYGFFVMSRQKWWHSASSTTMAWTWSIMGSIVFPTVVLRNSKSAVWMPCQIRPSSREPRAKLWWVGRFLQVFFGLVLRIYVIFTK